MEELFMVMEGQCPACGGELRIVRVAGTKAFHRDYQFMGEFETKTWERGFDATIGEVEYQCTSCGKKYSAWVNRFGDWTL